MRIKSTDLAKHVQGSNMLLFYECLTAMAKLVLDKCSGIQEVPGGCESSFKFIFDE